ncbi:MAG: NADH-ubiquinone oxidoreductase chain H, partial [uncultured Solirubrobacteraceae bacterium]
ERPHAVGRAAAGGRRGARAGVPGAAHRRRQPFAGRGRPTGGRDRPSAALAAGDLRQLAVPPRAAAAPRGSGHGVGYRAVGAGLPRHRPGDRRAGVRRGTGLRDPGGVHGRLGRRAAPGRGRRLPVRRADAGLRDAADDGRDRRGHARGVAAPDRHRRRPARGPDARLAATGVRFVLAVGHGGRVHRAVRPAASAQRAGWRRLLRLHGRAGGHGRPRAEGARARGRGHDRRAVPGRLARAAAARGGVDGAQNARSRGADALDRAATAALRGRAAADVRVEGGHPRGHRRHRLGGPGDARLLPM